MKQLLEKRAKIFEEARGLVLKAEQETRALTPEEQTKYDAIMSDVKALGETIERSRQSSEFNAELDKSVGPLAPAATATRATGSDLREVAMDKFLRNGASTLTDEQRSALGRETVGLGKDQLHFRAASPLSDVTGTAGAYTVPQGFLAELEVAMKWFGGIRTSKARIIRTATGNQLPWPSLNDTYNTGSLVAENTQIQQASTEMSFSHITLGAYKFTSGLVLVPIELIQDSAFDVQAFVAQALGTRLGRSQNTYFTAGTGASQPTGVLTAAALGVTGATGETAKWVYNDIVNLTHSVDPAYRAGAQFMLHDSTAAVTEQMLDGNGRPLLNSSFIGINNEVKAGEPGKATYTILGYPVVINNDMPTMAANAKSALFGDFTRFLIRDVMDLMLVRFGEKYMDYGQIGFAAFSRSDSNLQDAGTHPIKYFANSAT